MSERPATYYEILQVSPRARPEGVRRAYRRLAQKYHPDKMPGSADAQRVMAALNEAYAVLSDADTRARYDRSLDDARMQSRLAFRRRLAEVQAEDRAWPWWVLFATLTFSAAAIGVSVYKGYVPGAGAPATKFTSR